MPDKKAYNFKVQYLYGRHGSICGGHKREGGCALPGETSEFAKSYGHREMAGRIQRSQQRP